MIRIGFACALSALALGNVWGDESKFLEEQALRFETKLSEAIGELGELNAEIAKEKAPFLEAVNADRLKVAQLRNDIESSLLSKSEIRNELSELRSEVDERVQHLGYADSMLSEYIGDFEARLSVTEDQLYRDELKTYRFGAGAGFSSENEEKIREQFKLLDLAVGRLEGLLGGAQFSGKAVADDGALVEGDFLLYGPTALFMSKDRSQIGTAVGETNLSEPVLVETPGLKGDNFAMALNGTEAGIVLDSSLGKAVGIQSARWSLGEHVGKGGYVGYAIIGFAGLSMIVALMKFLQLAARRGAPEEQSDRILGLVAEGKGENAMAEVETLRPPYRGVIRLALQNRDEEDDVLDEVVLGELQRQKSRLERKLPLLALIAATTPLMGLLGTVVGMIKTFALITVFGSGEAKSLSSGISEALVTTEFGLLVAIPTLLLHGVLNRLSKERIACLEEFAADFIVGMRKAKRKVLGA